jgi:hypothetical protein
MKIVREKPTATISINFNHPNLSMKTLEKMALNLLQHINEERQCGISGFTRVTDINASIRRKS